MKITEIFDVQNSDNNLILGQNTYILIDDYEDCNNRLHDHSTTLELLTQRALNLSLFKGSPQKLKIAKPSYHTKNEKLKQVQKAKLHVVTSDELMIIKKLLMVNLRSFKIMQKLFRENKELQVLLNNSRVFAKKQKQKIEYVQNENENLKKTETRLKKRMESFIRQLNRVSKSFIAGFKDDYHDNCDNNVSLNNDKSKDKSNSQKLELAFNLSTNVAYRLHDDANKLLKINNVYQELSFTYDVALPDLKIRLAPEIVELPSSNFLNSFDCPIGYPLLLWQNKKAFVDHDEKCDESKVSHPKVNECPYKIEKDIQNAIRLHSVNSSVWKSFLLMKTIHEFMIFNQVCELIKAFLIAGEACDSEETPSGIDETTFVQLENLNPYSFASESTSKCTSLSSLTLDDISDEIPECINRSNASLNEITDVILNEKIEEHKKKRYPKIKVFYSLKKIHKKYVNGASRNKKSRIKVSGDQSCSIKRSSISIGVGDSYIISVDQESQVDNNFFVEPTFETDRNESNVNLTNDEFDEKDSNTKALSSTRKDFRKSLKSLEDIIKSCQQRSDEEGATQKKKSRKKLSHNERKDTEMQRYVETKVKEAKKKKRNLFDSYYKKENRKTSELPEMRKMYQVILENRLSQGLSFEYSTPDKSKVQLLFVSKSTDARMH